MSFSSFDDVYVALASMAPGFLIMHFRNQFVTGRTPNVGEGAFLFVIISAVYYSFSYPIYKIVAIENPISSFVFYFMAPTILGVIFGITYQKQVFRRLARSLGLSTVHSAPTAWDYVFSRTQSRHWTWIIVTTKENEKLHGIFGGQSFASSDSSNRDLYIEKIADENFNLVERDHGLWVKASDIKFIEIIPD